MAATASVGNAPPSRAIVFDCAAPAVGGQAFCNQLAADLARVSGLGARPAGKPGERALHVRAARVDARTARVSLAAGVFDGRQLQVRERQELTLSVADAKAGPGSALALVYPIVQMLERLR